MNHDYITIVTAHEPANKTFIKSFDGSIIKQPPKRFGQRKARCVHVPTIQHLQQILADVANNHYEIDILGFIPGLEGKTFNILSKKDLVEKFNLPTEHSFVPNPYYMDFMTGEFYTARLKTTFKPSSYFTFDFDEPEGTPDNLKFATHELRWTAMCNFLPMLKGVAHLIAPSNSSRVYDKDSYTSVSPGNAHVFFKAKNANHIETFGKTIGVIAFDRGYGFYRKIKGGKAKSTIIDLCTFSCERELFDGKPLVTENLGVLPPNIKFVEGVPELDTWLLPLPTEHEQKIAGVKFTERQGLAKIQDHELLTMDSLVTCELQKEPISIRDLTARTDWGDKLRCHAIFRPESSSWAGILNRTAIGEITHFDIGTQTHYYLNYSNSDSFVGVEGFTTEPKPPEAVLENKPPLVDFMNCNFKKPPEAVLVVEHEPNRLEKEIDELGRMPDQNRAEYNVKLSGIFSEISKLTVIEQSSNIQLLANSGCGTVSQLTKLLKAWVKENQTVMSMPLDDKMTPIIERCVMLTKGSGGFFDIESMEFQTKDNFNLTNIRHCSGDLLPSHIVSGNGGMVASEVGWQPTNDKFFTSNNGTTLVNSYKPRRQYNPKYHDVSSWVTLVKHVAGDEADLLMKHIAYTLFHPEKKIMWQVLIHGAARTGKSLLFNIFEWALGDAFKTMSNDQLKQGWDDAYVQTKVIKFEEVMGVRAAQFNELKTKFSNNDFEQLNPKGGNKVTQQNLLSMYMLSNSSRCVKFDQDQKKLLVIAAPHKAIYGTDAHNGDDWTQQEQDFYTKLSEDLKDDDFCNGILFYLQNLDVPDFTVGTLPRRTQAEYDMIKQSKSDREVVIEEMIEEQSGVFANEAFRLDTLSEELRGNYVKCNRSILADILTKQGFFEIIWKDNGKSGKFWTSISRFNTYSPTDAYTALNFLPTKTKIGVFNKGF